MANPFDMFTPKESKHKIKALNGAEVTLRDLTAEESSVITAKMFDGYDEVGRAKLRVGGFAASNIERVATALVEPKMTVRQLNKLSASSSDAINELVAIISPIKLTEDDEGN